MDNLIDREELEVEYTDKQIAKLTDKDIKYLNDLLWDYIKKVVDGLLRRS